MLALSFTRLRGLNKTSGFRLALLFLSTFGLASLCLCIFLYVEVRRSTIESLFRVVGRETLRLNRLSDDRLLERTDINQDMEQNGRAIALFREDGTKIAGAELPFPSPQDWSKSFRSRAKGGEQSPDLFCFAAPRRPANLLLVCRSSREIISIQEVFRRVLLLGMAAMTLIGASAAVILGALSLQQIESITGSVKTIMEGDLRGRLSLAGLSGDLAQLAGVVNEMLSRLERLMMEVKHSSENIAHDLRTPLTRVLAKLERSIRSVNTISDMKELNSEAVSDIRQIVYRFSALLRISELEDRLRRSEFKTVNLADIARDALGFYEPLASEKNVVIVLKDVNDDAFVYGDRSLLFESISNLLDNALKYSHAEQRIEVMISAEPITLEIRDFGPGVDLTDVDLLVERYKKKDFRCQSPGYGVGLSIVDSIARLHNVTFSLLNSYPGCKARMVFNDRHIST